MRKYRIELEVSVYEDWFDIRDFFLFLEDFNENNKEKAYVKIKKKRIIKEDD